MRARIRMRARARARWPSARFWLLPRLRGVQASGEGMSQQMAACAYASLMAQVCWGSCWQSTQAKLPMQLEFLAVKYMPAKVMLVVALRAGADKQRQRRPPEQLCFTLTTPLRLAFRSLLMRTMRYPQQQSSSPNTFMLADVPDTTVTFSIMGWSLKAYPAMVKPQQRAPGLNSGPAPKTDWLEGVSGLQKLMKMPLREANQSAISSAQSAAAKELVTPSTPESLVSLISLMPIGQAARSRVALVALTNLFFRYTAEEFQLSRAAIDACDESLKSRQRKVKTLPQLLTWDAICYTQELSASSVMPGPLTSRPQQALLMVEMSVRKLAAVQVRLQMAEIWSPKSMSSRLMPAPEKMFMQVLKLVRYLVLVKLLLSMSYPKSKDSHPAFSQINEYI